MLKQFYLIRQKGKYIYLNPKIEGTKISFEIKEGKNQLKGWNNRGNLKCPCCKQITDVKEIKKQSKNRQLNQKLLAVIFKTKNGKIYKVPTQTDREALKLLPSIEEFKPKENMHRNSAGGDTFSWGITEWGQLFNNRQLFAIKIFIEKHNEIKSTFGTQITDYQKAILTYLAIWVNRLITRLTSFGLLDISNGGKVNDLFGRQAIPMIFDYPEINPLNNDQLSWILRVIKSENFLIPSICLNSQSGQKHQFQKKQLDVVVTDPPYYDAIAYADLSDFFYVWLKRTIFDLYPLNFATPQTPKSEECTALKHHHENNETKAFLHFESKLLDIFDAIEYQTKDLVSIMFAHQSTQAWTTLCNSILNAKMNLVSSWANETETTTALKTGKDFLSTSITVACKPYLKSGIGDYKEVSQEVLQLIKAEVQQLYALGFRGADLLTACFGKAVSVFGQYESVEKANGDLVTVAELLEMAREAAFNAIVSDIDTDDLTRFYIGWLNLFGFSEAVHDDVRRISQIGLSVDIHKIYDQSILVSDGDKGQLGDMKARIGEDSRLGLRSVRNHDIDIAHRMMYLYDPANASRTELLDYIADKAPHASRPAWRVLNSLAELLPDSKKMKDRKLATGLLSNQENLLREATNRQEKTSQQSTIEFE